MKLSGLTLKNENNKEGDIEIIIQKAQDPFIPFSQLEIDLNNLEVLLNYNKVSEIKDLLTKIVKTYQSNSEIVDHVYLEQNKFVKSSFADHSKNKIIKIK